MTTFEESVQETKLALERAVLYHGRRKSWLDMAHRAQMGAIFGLLLGAAALPSWTPLLGALAVASAALELVFRMVPAACANAMAQQHYMAILSEMNRAASPTRQMLKTWEARRKWFDQANPKRLKALEAECWNEVARSNALDGEVIELPLVRRLTKNLMPHQDIVHA
jgi:hypothetical protein